MKYQEFIQYLVLTPTPQHCIQLHQPTQHCNKHQTP